MNLSQQSLRINDSARQALSQALDFIFPPQCLLCGALLETDAQNRLFCAGCLGQMHLHDGPICRRCGSAFQSREGEDHLCGLCLQRNAAFDRARSLGPYAGILRKAIHALKYDRDCQLAKPLGMLLAERGPGLLGRRAYECIMPVPLHTARLRQRGFNQSLVLARCVGKAWGVPVAAEVLTKLRQTQPQTLLPLAQRRRNVRGAFACTRRLHYTRVLLVDDVYTSGSTAHECARVLKRHGVEQVDVLTLARTP